MKGGPRSGCYLLSEPSNGKIRRNAKAVNSRTAHTYSPITTAKVAGTGSGRDAKQVLVIVGEDMCPGVLSSI